MIIKISFDTKAQKDLDRLSIQLRNRMLHKLDFYLHQNDPVKFAKRLTNSKLGSYRFRIGSYRVLFDVNVNGKIRILRILRIVKRSEVYGLL